MQSSSRKSQDDYSVFDEETPHDFSELIKRERTMTFTNALATAIRVSKSLSIKSISSEENLYNRIIVEKGEKRQELLIPELRFVEFDFLSFKKTEGQSSLHDILKMYSNGF
mmetsp:Transcript_13897/g.12311  ORF Transcript_13897/g.12311 Transcript_13897/m.12311 type:complete len:111 (+) Transcript_13897:3-335(+)